MRNRARYLYASGFAALLIAMTPGVAFATESDADSIEGGIDDLTDGIDGFLDFLFDALRGILG